MNDVALDKISEKEALNLLNKMEDADEELFSLRKKFVRDLQEILPAIKILKLRKSEEDFNRKLLHQYRDRAIKNNFQSTILPQNPRLYCLGFYFINLIRIILFLPAAIAVCLSINRIVNKVASVESCFQEFPPS